MTAFVIKGVSYDNDVSTLGLFYTNQAEDDISNITEEFFRLVQRGYLSLISNDGLKGLIYTDLSVYKSFRIEGFQETTIVGEPEEIEEPEETEGSE